MNVLSGTLIEDRSGDRFFELEDGTRIVAGTTGGSFPTLSTDREYLIGFRPQDMVYLNGDDPAEAHGEKTVISPDLAFVETVGSTSTLHLEYQGKEVYALNTGPVHMEAGSTLSFSLDPQKLYVYDPETGDLIAAGSKIPSFSQ